MTLEIKNPLATLIAIPLLALMVIAQSAVFSGINLFQGAANVVLLSVLAWAVQEQVRTAWQWSLIATLFVSIASALPPWAIALGYITSTGLTITLRRWLWKFPFLAMMVASFFCTLLTQTIEALGLRLYGLNFSWYNAFYRVMLPSAMLNLLGAIPIYAILTDLAKWIHPQEMKI